MTFAAHIERIDRAVQGHLGGITVQYSPQHEGPVPIDAVFDERYVFDRQGDDGVELVGPALFVRVADLPIHPDDDEPTVTVGETIYRVVERKPDGLGGMLLRLMRTEL